MPVSETPKSLQEKRDKMKVLSEQTNFSPEEVETLMKCTYYSQRKVVNMGKDLHSLLEEWPFLFHDIGMMVHFQELTGASLRETFICSVEKKGKRLLDFMRTICAGKCKRVLEAVTKLKILREQLKGCSEDVKDMVLLLAYFDEKEENLFHYVEETCLAREVQVESLPVTPCIIVCGTSCYTSRQFMLSVDCCERPNPNLHNCHLFDVFKLLLSQYPLSSGSSLYT
ncbi:uncharacterized protein LOC117774714 [Hippoglossus hippoglossus]|uniref:uncharacterized protein LOC117774714 n=1 Tax=Hippoglossus hippoglossus TaxID=8267 RepID=UPI00148DBBD4|nr:uncharacterized protein LOC117774714 [Hippoglossus hippoglossus]